MVAPVISHVSDTARWVAAYRATESARADAIFDDPFAARLAGDRGRVIAAQMRTTMGSGWAIVMRTKAIDDLVLAAIIEGADRVLNLAAGLDTRPYRLALPPSLRWVEADLPALVEEKEYLLKGDTPRCTLVREKVDLADAGARAAFLDRALAGASRALVITEGLLPYMDETSVRDLVSALAARGEIQSYVTDLLSPAVASRLRRAARELFADDVKIQFAPRNGVAFFTPFGWKATAVRSNFRDASRAHRLPFFLRPFALFPDPDPENPGDKPWAAVVRFDRQGRPALTASK